MRRRVHSERDDLDWTVRRLWLPEGLRPIGVRQVHSGAARPSSYAGLGMLVSPIFTVVFGLPTMFVLLPLRFARLAPWRVEAVSRPWGRFGPTRTMHWRVKGWAESARAVEEIAAALGRGERQPDVSGAERDDY